MSAYGKNRLHFSQARCSSCSLLISQPQASAPEMTAYYESTYYQDVWPDPEFIWTHNTTAYQRYELPLMEQLWKEFAPPAGGRVAEVGCGYGVMLGLLQERGFQAEGCELSQKAVDFCLTQRLNVKRGQWPGIPLERGVFDAAISFQVIEHVANPFLFVSELTDLVRPGGAVVVVTEDAYNAQFYWERGGARLTGRIPPFRSSSDHTFVFSAENLRSVMSQAGCEKVSTRSFTYYPIKESAHWRAYKSIFRLLDKGMGRGEFLMSVGKKCKR